jgi:hypothetical protein
MNLKKDRTPHPRSPEALKIQAQHWDVTVGCFLQKYFVL